MRNPVALGVLVALGILLFITVVIVVNLEEDPTSIAQAEFALTWIARAVGIFIAAVAATALLVAALNAEPLRRVFAFVPALLAGLLLIRVEWSVALSLGALAVAFLLRRLLAGRWRASDRARGVEPLSVSECRAE